MYIINEEGRAHCNLARFSFHQDSFIPQLAKVFHTEFLNSLIFRTFHPALFYAIQYRAHFECAVLHVRVFSHQRMFELVGLSVKRMVKTLLLVLKSVLVRMGRPLLIC